MKRNVSHNIVNRTDKDTDILNDRLIRTDELSILHAFKLKYDIKDPQNRTSLHIAAEAGCIDAVNLLLDIGSDCNSRDNKGTSPLWIACSYGHVQIVESLLCSGIEVYVNYPDLNDDTPILIAASNGYFDIVEKLANTKGLDINHVNSHGVSPLKAAASRGYVNIVLLLISKGANIYVSDYDGVTPLRAACMKGHSDVVKALIVRDADVNAADKNKCSPLYIASMYGHISIVKQLVKANAEVNSLNCANGTSPLWIASKYGHLEVVQFLLDRAHASPDLLEKGTKRSALHVAIRDRREAVALILVKYCDVDLLDKDGRSPVSYATDYDFRMRLKRAMNQNFNTSSAAFGYGRSLRLPSHIILSSDEEGEVEWAQAPVGISTAFVSSAHSELQYWLTYECRLATDVVERVAHKLASLSICSKTQVKDCFDRDKSLFLALSLRREVVEVILKSLSNCTLTSPVDMHSLTGEVQYNNQSYSSNLSEYDSFLLSVAGTDNTSRNQHNSDIVDYASDGADSIACHEFSESDRESGAMDSSLFSMSRALSVNFHDTLEDKDDDVTDMEIAQQMSFSHDLVMSLRLTGSIGAGEKNDDSDDDSDCDCSRIDLMHRMSWTQTDGHGHSDTQPTLIITEEEVDRKDIRDRLGRLETVELEGTYTVINDTDGTKVTTNVLVRFNLNLVSLAAEHHLLRALQHKDCFVQALALLDPTSLNSALQSSSQTNQESPVDSSLPFEWHELFFDCYALITEAGSFDLREFLSVYRNSLSVHQLYLFASKIIKMLDAIHWLGYCWYSLQLCNIRVFPMKGINDVIMVTLKGSNLEFAQSSAITISINESQSMNTMIGLDIAYMPPELAAILLSSLPTTPAIVYPYTSRVDIWCLGILLMELLGVDIDKFLMDSPLHDQSSEEAVMKQLLSARSELKQLKLQSRIVRFVPGSEVVKLRKFLLEILVVDPRSRPDIEFIKARELSS